MNTYFLQFRVIPTIDNEQYELAEGALAHCWVLENDPQAAGTKAAFQISKFDWEITCLEIPPIEVEEEQFAEQDLGLEQFRKAQVGGMAIVYTAWARDKKTSTGPVTLKSSYKTDLQWFLKEQKIQSNIRCSRLGMARLVRHTYLDCNQTCQCGVLHCLRSYRRAATSRPFSHAYRKRPP